MSPQQLRSLADRFEKAGHKEKAAEVRVRASEREAPTLPTDLTAALHLQPPGVVLPAWGSRHWTT